MAYENIGDHEKQPTDRPHLPATRHRARAEHRAGRRESPVCVGFSEVDRFAIRCYLSRFPSHRNYGDATTINAKDLPDFDLLCAGFPCQSFSIAGRRAGLSDTRGTLIFDVLRIAQEKRPRFLLLENVKGLLSHGSGRTFHTILVSLDEIGYDCQWEVLNAKNFGVPQNRERVFVVGHLRGQPRPQVFPLGTIDPDGLEANPEELREVASALRARYSGGNARGSYIRVENKQGDGFVSRERSGAVRAGASRNYQTVVDGLRIRRLTPLECERLMGFPDGWTDCGLSDTQRYKMLGNAVVPQCVAAVVERLAMGSLF